MPDTITRAHAQRILQSRIDRDVRDRQRECQLALNDLVWALANWHEARGKSDFMYDTVRGLRDDVSNLEAELYAELDEAGIVPDCEMETTDLDSLIGKVVRS